jgi:catechol 2,3-dioxygenase
MKIQSLGHVVLKVRDQKKAEAFYNGILGLPIVAHLDSLNMTFFSLGDHHDFAVMAIGDDAEAAPEKSPGLLHVAFKVGESLDDLRETKRVLEAAGITPDVRDHIVSQSLYFNDPDGNGLELYVDGSDAWKQDPQLVAHMEPLEID